MSSHPLGFRFSQFTTPNTSSTSVTSKKTALAINNKIMNQQQLQFQNQNNQQQQQHQGIKKIPIPIKHQLQQQQKQQSPQHHLSSLQQKQINHHQQQQQLQQIQQQQQQHHQQQHQQQQQQQVQQQHQVTQQQPQQLQSQQPLPPPQYSSATNSLSGSETDISNENLSMEQRYVIRNTPRVEPQGQENLQEIVQSGSENQVRYVSTTDPRFSSNTSTDSTRYASSTRSISETRNPIYQQQQGGTVVIVNSGQQPSNNNNNSNRNSLKESNSNRSSMDVSTCSYNTLIIHNDDSMYSINNRDYPIQSELMKKDRPRSYGEQGMQEITEIPDDYLNQSHVLKHLAKEIKIPIKRRSNTRDSGVSENTDVKDPPKYSQWIIEEQNEQNNNKMKSKSQPDLSKLSDVDLDAMETIVKENQLLKQQLYTCYMKVAKTHKLEEEVTNVYRVHEELKQTCERREKLEHAARKRLQNDLQRVQELNCVMKDQVDILQSQLLAPSEHQILIAQFFTQNKELSAAKERQEIELVAQRATLQEQRNHIGILDTALTNAQHNIRRLEEELRKKQLYIERLTQLHGALQLKQNERKLRIDYESELCKESNRSGSSTNSDSKWQLQEKNSNYRLDSEQRDDQALRQNMSSKLVAAMQQNNNIQEDRIINEAKHEKLRYLEEVHTAQRNANDLQTHLKFLESKLAEKDAVIRLLQDKKACGSSFDSYNSYGLSPLGFNSQASFNASNTSFNTATNTSILDQAYSGSTTNFIPNPATINTNYVSNQSLPYVTGSSGGGVIVPTNKTNSYGQSTINLHAIAGQYAQNQSTNVTGTNTVVGIGGYTNSSYDSTPNFPTQNTSSSTNTSNSYDPTTPTSLSYDQLAARKSIDDHHIMKKQFDEQLLTKVSQMSLEQVTKLLAQKQRELKSTSILLNQMKNSNCSSGRSSSSSNRNAQTDKEEFC